MTRNEAAGAAPTPYDNPSSDDLPWAMAPLGWYMDFALKPTIVALEKRGMYVYACVVAMFLCLCVGMTKGLLNMRAEPQADLGTLQAMKHWPMMPVVMLVATHFVVALYGQNQFRDLKKSLRPPLPILFPFLVGKIFLLFRLAMAYSSNRLSHTLEFFVRQELILIALHVTGSMIFLPLVPQKSERLSDMLRVFWFIFAMDFGKTFADYILWTTWPLGGAIADYVDRLPDQQSQICVSLLIHFVFDAMQTGASLFTMFLSRWSFFHRRSMRKTRARRRLLPASSDASPNTVNCEYYKNRRCKFAMDLVIFNIINVDGFWLRRLFQNRGGTLLDTKEAQELSDATARHIYLTRAAYAGVEERWMQGFETCARQK